MAYVGLMFVLVSACVNTLTLIRVSEETKSGYHLLATARRNEVTFLLLMYQQLPKKRSLSLIILRRRLDHIDSLPSLTTMFYRNLVFLRRDSGSCRAIPVKPKEMVAGLGEDKIVMINLSQESKIQYIWRICLRLWLMIYRA
ncbi:unnamed protein product [Eruca vesicaria subsp. sativa]|uniref:Uncharacterized protein n=1 Tax=Eruca vesicaria subsp. sativa TaxID=29727 RepID=A0ABC8LSR3_ERUVS|nr:unnamed protein product [Eruca vesicaria subsp. sativa]